MDVLCQDLLFNIVSLITIHDLLKYRSVCKTWKSVIDYKLSKSKCFESNWLKHSDLPKIPYQQTLGIPCLRKTIIQYGVMIEICKKYDKMENKTEYILVICNYCGNKYAFPIFKTRRQWEIIDIFESSFKNSLRLVFATRIGLTDRIFLLDLDSLTITSKIKNLNQSEYFINESFQRILWMNSYHRNMFLSLYSIEILNTTTNFPKNIIQETWRTFEIKDQYVYQYRVISDANRVFHFQNKTNFWCFEVIHKYGFIEYVLYGIVKDRWTEKHSFTTKHIYLYPLFCEYMNSFLFFRWKNDRLILHRSASCKFF